MITFDILSEARSLLVTIVGSGAFILGSWVVFQIWTHRQRQKEYESLKKEITALRDRIESTPGLYSITAKHDSGGTHFEVTAPSRADCVWLYDNYKPLTPGKDQGRTDYMN